MDTKDLHGTYRQVSIDDIDEPEIPVRSVVDEDEFEQLCESIKRDGILEPLLLHDKGNGRYEVVAGHMRLLAARRVGLATVPAIVKKYTFDELIAARIAENLYRTQPDPVDEGRFYRYLIEECGKTVEEIAKLIGKSKNYVYQRLEATGWAPEIQEAVQKGEISFSVARELATIEDEQTRKALTEYAKESGASVATVKAWKAQYAAQKAAVAAAQEQGGGAEAVEEVVIEPVEGRLICDVCKRAKPASQVHYYRICDECLQGRQVETAGEG